MIAGDENIQAGVLELNGLDRIGLRIAWNDAFGVPSPSHISMMFMRKALIWDAQCRRYGGLSPALKRALNGTAGGKPSNMPAAVAAKPGTQLIREWNGRRYSVEVKDGGYFLAGEHFKSLSAIALHITGTNWSGPRFFGLTGKKGAHR
jgi:hypothetical protein